MSCIVPKMCFVRRKPVKKDYKEWTARILQFLFASTGSAISLNITEI